jgi:glyoxylase-like metal-dependent hydrolase (beta-lactamase superfamily II)
MEIKRIIVGGLQTNCYLIIDGGELAVVDPGADAKFIIFEVKRSNALAKIIVDTHYHFDHTDANQQVKAAIGAPIAIGELDKDFVAGFKADRFLNDGDTIGIGKIKMTVLNTPGHTKGGICLLGNDFVISGDTIFAGTVGRMDLPGGSIDDMERSLAKLDKMIPPGAMVYPGHGESFKFKKGEIQKWI